MSDSASGAGPSGPSGADLRASDCEHELESARRAASVAVRHEALAQTGLRPHRQLHQRMAAIHRQSQLRHLVTARLYRSLAAKVRAASDGPAIQSVPPLLAATAELAGSAGAIIALFDSRQNEMLVLASDVTARRAHEVEFAFGEGPSRDAYRTRNLIAASGQEISQRWQLYGPQVTGLDVRAVTAIPMKLDSVCLGSLTLLNPVGAIGSREALAAVGEALAHSLFCGRLGGPAGTLLQGGDCRPTVHQAAGVISARTGCSIDDALTLIRARAFAEACDVGDVAQRIIDGTQNL